MQRDDAYLLDIVIAAKRIQNHLKGITWEAFCQSELHQDAVVKALEIMGEVAQRISTELKEIHSSVPWQEMAGMRNRLIHEYFDIDLEKVWNTVQVDIPKLIALIEPLIIKEQE